VGELAMRLRDAMQEVLAGWPDDLPLSWRDRLGSVQLGFDDMDPSLELEVWEPIFPVRKGKLFPGMPKGAHMLRAFEGIDPAKVRCVVLGQDPYPEPGFATGRAFECGNVARWGELDKMFSRSLRALMLQVVAARTGNAGYARSFADWPAMRDGLESGAIPFDDPKTLIDKWQAQHMLLLASGYTLTRFAVDTHAHQRDGHFPLWRPFGRELLKMLIAPGTPLVILGLGTVAAELLSSVGAREGRHGNLGVVLRHHPAQADDFLKSPNPFLECNAHLRAMGAEPIQW
jgi:uracil-DNA glycosylase